MSSNRVTVGSFENVSLPQVGLSDVVAKIDTGAFSGAIHCTDIRVVRRGPLRKSILRFTPAGLAGLATETDRFEKRHVRSATGHRVRRYLIQTEIVLQGKTYQIDIGLSDRSDMRYQVLIGRRFLREQQMLVDVELNMQYDDEGEKIK